jgi:hypothetical protein
VSNLIDPLIDMPLQKAEKCLRDQYEDIDAQARISLSKFAKAPPNLNWGTALKRVEVEGAGKNQPLTEIINQLATVERLLEALKWAKEGSDFKDWKLDKCNPTTSSGKKDSRGDLDHDLILIHPIEKTFALFEVSDVITETKDTNKKERKDLKSLKLLRGSTHKPSKENEYDQYRRFLVVSEEFGRRLLKTNNRHVVKQLVGEERAAVRYECRYSGNGTTILEVFPGETDWEKHYRELRSFLKREGHGDVPSKLVLNGIRLGAWVIEQQKNRGNLSPEHLDLLESIDFVWDIIDPMSNDE